MKIAYAVTASAAAVMLCRVVWARRPWQGQGCFTPGPQETENYEYACGVLFMMIFPPYFLVYDQTLLASAAGHALVVAGLAVGRGAVCHEHRAGHQSLVHARLQPHRIRGPGNDVFFSI